MLLAKYYMHVYVNPDLFHLAGATASDPCRRRGVKKIWLDSSSTAVVTLLGDNHDAGHRHTAAAGTPAAGVPPDGVRFRRMQLSGPSRGG